MKNYASILLMVFGLFTASGVYAGNLNIVLYYNGPAAVNTGANPKIAAFNTFCNGTCVPTTQFNLLNPLNNQVIGSANVWGNNFNFASDGKSECFTEFIAYNLPGGTIYTLGYAGGTCGAFIDPALVKPFMVHSPGAALIAGGGSGNIVGGTGIYQNIKGTYVDKVFVEFVNYNITYYDDLYFTLSIRL